VDAQAKARRRRCLWHGLAPPEKRARDSTSAPGRAAVDLVSLLFLERSGADAGELGSLADSSESRIRVEGRAGQVVAVDGAREECERDVLVPAKRDAARREVARLRIADQQPLRQGLPVAGVGARTFLACPAR